MHVLSSGALKALICNFDIATAVAVPEFTSRAIDLNSVAVTEKKEEGGKR
jgi:hypothetical protein